MGRRLLLALIAAGAMFAAAFIVLLAFFLLPALPSLNLNPFGWNGLFTLSSDKREQARLIQRLEEGYAHEADGNYDAAIAAFGEVAKAKPDLVDVREAQFQLGEAHILNRDLGSAALVLQDFYDRYPEDARHDEVAFILGTTYRQLKQWDKAARFLKEYSQRNSIIEPYARYQLGMTYRDAGNLPQATEELSKAVTGSGPRLFEIEVMEQIAEASLKLNDPNTAAAWYEKIKPRAVSNAYKSELNYRIALTQKAAGRTLEAKNLLLLNVASYPSSYYTLLSLDELNKIDPTAVGYFQEGLIGYLNGKYDKAIENFGQHLMRQPQSPDAADALYFQGMAFQKQGSYAQSIAKFDQLIRVYPSSTRVGDAWFQKAESQWRSKSYSDAVDTYRRLAAILPQHELAQQARWEAGQLLEVLGRFSEARGEYATLQQNYPTGKYAEDAMFRHGLIFFKEGQYDKATQIWDGYLRNYPEGKQRARGAYWASKSARLAGRSDEVGRYVQQAIQYEPDEYYGFRAKSITGSTSSRPSSDWLRQSLLAPDSEVERQQAVDWLARWISPPPTITVLSSITSTIQDDASFKRGQELLKVGLRQEAVNEFKDVMERFRSDGIAQLQLSLFFRDAKLYQPSIAAAQRLAILSGEKSYLNLPRMLLKLLYPPYYAHLVLAEADKGNFDPILLLSLILQESNFDRNALSSAEARGLTQVIPPTAEWLVQKMGLGSFSPDDLYKPYFSIRLGANYLGGLLTQFEGNPFFALAGYNGGPGNVSRWSNNNPKYDVDLFAEDIDYSETNLYLKLVLQNYEMYRFIYGSAAE